MEVEDTVDKKKLTVVEHAGALKEMSLNVGDVTISSDMNGLRFDFWYEMIIIKNLFLYVEDDLIKIDWENNLQEEEGCYIDFTDANYRFILEECVKKFIEQNEWIQIYLREYGERARPPRVNQFLNYEKSQKTEPDWKKVCS